MKQKFTLLAILLLVALFAFGQKPEVKNNETFWKSKAERQIKGLIQNDIGLKRNHLIQNNNNFPQNSNLKSTQQIKQRLDSLVNQYWDETTSQWITDGKQEFIYNANLDLAQYLIYFWNDASSQWVGEIKYEYTYDADGNLTQELFNGWDESNSQWVVWGKTEYTYDNNGNVTQDLFYVWDETTSQWVAYFNREYTYDTNGNLTQILIYLRDETSGQWIVDGKIEYTYDANGNLTQDIEYDWNENTSQWVGDWKYDYTYDANWYLIQKLDYAWDENTIQWIADSKNEYNYDTKGNLTQDFYYVWDMTISQWITYWKYEYAYDNTYSFSDLILPHLYTIDAVNMYFNHMLTGFVDYNWDETLSEWVIDGKGTFYYSEQNITSVSKIKGGELSIYPNPSIDYLNIELPSNMNVSFIEIINMQGMAVKRKEVETNQNNIDVQDLSSGVYLIRVHTDNGIVMKKLIKQ